MGGSLRFRAGRRTTVVAALTVLTLLAEFLHAGAARAAEGEPTAADRGLVVSAWRAGGAQVRAAAAAALVGSDDQVRAFLESGLREAQRLDERDVLVGVITEGGPAVRAAAKQALDAAEAGDGDAISTFLGSGWQEASDIDARVSVNQLMASGGPQVREVAQRALDSEDPALLRTFLDSGWQTQWVTDQRLRVNQAMATGGPQVRAAGQKALDAGTPEALEQFLEYEWAVASARDDEVATLTDLLAQAEAAGKIAAEETRQAKEEAARAKEAAEAARRAAAAAAAATEAARQNTEQAAAHAKRAAVAAEKAAQSAKVAVQAASAASRAARAAATAAARAAAAASLAGQAAAKARKAAAAAATDQAKAAAARAAAEEANAIARGARDFASKADQAGQAIEAGMAAVDAAMSAANNANLAAAANDEAVRHANAAGANAAEAVAAAQRARANAERAVRAAQAAQRYMQVARNAAFAARDAAVRAADNAEAAARAAIEAAEHAGEAAEAARRAAENAAAATVAAQAAVDAANQAIGVFEAARQADAERLAVARDQGLEAAQDANTAYEAQQRVADWDVEQAARRDAETNGLIAEARNPATPRAAAVAAGRRVALALADAHGTWTRQAALSALGGSDEQVLSFVRTGLDSAAAQDDRHAVMNLATADNTALRDAARAALAGGDADVRQFLRTQNYPGRYTADRVKVNQIQAAARTAGNMYLVQKAQEALDAENLRALRDFLDTGQYTAAAVGQRLQVNQVLADPDSGPEVEAAAQVALDGPPTALHEFLETGRYAAAERDYESAVHLAVVGGLLEKINQVAETAVQNALEANAVAAQARGDAEQAAAYANQAAASAQKAAGYASRAQGYANQAAQSAQKAAAAVDTARKAATRATASARSAVRSAAWAVSSQQVAAQAAAEANAAAQRAYDSAVAAGQDAEAAAAAAEQAYEEYEFARNAELLACNDMYTSKPATDLEELLGASDGEWFDNCVANVIADPAELATRAYVNSSYCEVFQEGSQGYQNCLHSVLDPAFAGTLRMTLLVQTLNAMAATFVPLAVVVAAGCVATVVCAMAVGSLITIGDVGLNLYRFVNGDQSLAETLLNLGRAALESLLLAGLGRVLSVGFRSLRALYVTARNANRAEGVLQVANFGRIRMLGLTACLRHSFDPATPVLLADGTYRPISRIEVGDRVLANDPRTGRTTGESVTRVLRHRDVELTDVRVVHGDGTTGTVRTTDGHPFWSETGGAWVDASDLAPGTRLRTPARVPATVGAVRSFAGSKVMYDLSLADVHTFYVRAGGAPVLVHNNYECRPFPNQFPERLDAELDLADSLGVRPVSPGQPGFDQAINEGRVKWAITMDGLIVVMPKVVQAEEISHPALTRGANVLAAGEAEIAGGGGLYIGVEITNHSGHFMPSDASLDFAVQVFHDAGIDFPPGSIHYAER
ncbi:polymorphic toxin-type HINT domain-containing protein [Phytohabitans kaempferiae]|uniref:Polymorphic toxin-type HINT domain-containing protein n=1 Tax=Phytohabitans kaempferiae TaxID=1620943 RepID=A0ABV6M520_9ACTN